mmetsp:Transcript_118666/g.331052  ORF Transcript_118666/g.331052 Transcript_118666/m.331052 type:complete len:246 (-) Transcript_118666:729-1466(-)
MAGTMTSDSLKNCWKRTLSVSIVMCSESSPSTFRPSVLELAVSCLLNVDATESNLAQIEALTSQASASPNSARSSRTTSARLGSLGLYSMTRWYTEARSSIVSGCSGLPPVRAAVYATAAHCARRVASLYLFIALPVFSALAPETAMTKRTAGSTVTMAKCSAGQNCQRPSDPLEHDMMPVWSSEPPKVPTPPAPSSWAASPGLKCLPFSTLPRYVYSSAGLRIDLANAVLPVEMPLNRSSTSHM